MKTENINEIFLSQMPENRVYIFGHNQSVGTAYSYVSHSGFFRMPQVGSETTLRIKAGGNANDTAAGTGAREIRLTGIDNAGAAITETLATAGASASASTTQQFLRLNSVEVTSSGTYADGTGSHSGDITIENTAGTQDWAIVEESHVGYPMSVSEKGCYTVPSGKTAYVTTSKVFTDKTKSTRYLFFYRPNILETSAPYSPMKVLFSLESGVDETEHDHKHPLGPFYGPCDLGFRSKVDTGTSEVAVEFEIVMIDN